MKFVFNIKAVQAFFLITGPSLFKTNFLKMCSLNMDKKGK